MYNTIIYVYIYIYIYYCIVNLPRGRLTNCTWATVAPFHPVAGVCGFDVSVVTNV